MINTDNYIFNGGHVSTKNININFGTFHIWHVQTHGHQINLFYLPADHEESTTVSVGVTTGLSDRQSVVTIHNQSMKSGFRGGSADDLKGHYTRLLKDEGSEHKPRLHMRNSDGTDDHWHYLFEKWIPIDSFLQRALHGSDLNDETKKKYFSHISHASMFLSNFPEEPGLVFEDGSVVQNGGCGNLDNPESTNDCIYGPCLYFKNNSK